MRARASAAPGYRSAVLARLSLLLLLGVAACAGGSGHPFGRWVGRVGEPCPGAALLKAGRGEAVFVRDDGSEVLHGTMATDGTFTTRLQTPGADKKGFVQTFTGQVRGDDASGTYTSPRCTAPVTLRAD